MARPRRLPTGPARHSRALNSASGPVRVLSRQSCEMTLPEPCIRASWQRRNAQYMIVFASSPSVGNEATPHQKRLLASVKRSFSRLTALSAPSCEVSPIRTATLSPNWNSSSLCRRSPLNTMSCWGVSLSPPQTTSDKHRRYRTDEMVLTSVVARETAHPELMKRLGESLSSEDARSDFEKLGFTWKLEDAE